LNSCPTAPADFPDFLAESGDMVDVAPLPSGKRLYNYGKSPFLMGKSTMFLAIFNS
jgi:hypothetical protein